MYDRSTQLRNSALIWSSTFINMASSNMLLVFISVRVFYQSESAFEAGLIAATRFIVPMFTAPLTDLLCRSISLRRLLVGTALTSGVNLAAMSFVGQADLRVLLPLLMVQGFLETTTKIARTVTIREIFGRDRVARVNSISNACHVLGNVAGALLAGGLVDAVQLDTVARCAAVMAAVSALSYSFLLIGDEPTGVHQQKPYWSGTIGLLSTDTAYQKPFFYLVSCTVLFQGYHQVQKTSLPIKGLDLSATGAALFQFCATAGVLLGTLSVAFRNRDGRPKTTDLAFGMLVGASASAAAWMVSLPALAALLYFLQMAVFETTYLRSQNAVLMATNRGDGARLLTLFHTLADAGMLGVTLAAGWLTDRIGGLQVTLGVAMAAVVVTLAIELVLRPLQPDSRRGLVG